MDTTESTSPSESTNDRNGEISAKTCLNSDNISQNQVSKSKNVGCTHYKRKAKFVVSICHFIY